jgi:hypothetical protein
MVAVVVVIALIVISGIGLFASLITLIVGAIQKSAPLRKKAILFGLTCMVVLICVSSFAALALASDLMDYLGFHPERTGSTIGDKRLPATSAQMREWFEWATGLQLPADVEILGGEMKEEGVFNKETYYLKMRVSKGFGQFLKDHFVKEQWDVAEVYFKSLTPAEAPYWRIDQVKDKACFSYFKDGWLVQTYQSIISYDSETGLAYFVGARGRE